MSSSCKQCSKCNDVLTIEHFYKNKNQCKNCIRLRKIEYRKANTIKVAESRRKYSKSSHGRKVRSEYRKTTRGYRNHLKAIRRGRIKQATPYWSEINLIRNVYEKAKWLETLTGLKYHVDHIVPLNSDFVCGLHVWSNLQILERSINESKGNSV